MIDAAKRFLEQVEKDEDLRRKLQELKYEAITDFAKEMGYDVTCEELEEAVKEIRAERLSVAEKLNLEDTDQVTGGDFWMGEEDSDGHELGCLLAYHGASYQISKNKWCEKNHYCNKTVFGWSESKLF